VCIKICKPLTYVSDGIGLTISKAVAKISFSKREVVYSWIPSRLFEAPLGKDLKHSDSLKQAIDGAE
jgi:hypothetical protein